MSTQVAPMWKMRINDCLRRSNKVNLSGEEIDGLEKIGTIKLMAQLDLSYVRTIHSFEGFKRQPALKTLIADGSAIASLKNISSLSNITAISLKNTPLLKSNQKFNVLASLILSIPNLRIFNGKVISQKTRTKIESAGYPKQETASLVDAGWIVECPCPPRSELIELAKYYGIYNDNFLEEEVNEEMIEEEEEEAEIVEEEEEESINKNEQTIEDTNNLNNSSNNKVSNRSAHNNNKDSDEKSHDKKTISSEQKENSNEYEEYENNGEAEYANDKNETETEYEYDNDNDNDNDNGNSEENEDDEKSSQKYPNPFNKPISEMSLLEKVVMVLRSNGYQIDPNNMQQSVLNTIDALCSEVEQMNSSVPSEQSSQI